MLRSPTGTVRDESGPDNLTTYLHDIRWAIEREKWSRVVGIIAPSEQEGRSSGTRPSQLGTEYLHLYKDAAKRLSQVGADSVSYENWSLYPVEGEDEGSALNVSGDLVLEDGSIYQMDLFFDVRENRVYLIKMMETDCIRLVEEFENSVSDKRWEKLARDLTYPKQVGLKYYEGRKAQFIYELIETCVVGTDCVSDINQIEKEDSKCEPTHEKKGYERYLKSISDFRVINIKEDKVYFEYKLYNGACRFEEHTHLKKQSAV